MPDIIILCFFGFFAGFIDSVVGGGGLIQLPGLMIVFPNVPFAFLAGTNKFSSFCGTLFAVIRYSRTIPLSKHIFLYCLPAALLFAFLGAKTVSMLDSNLIKPIVVVVLIAVGFYTFLRPAFGSLPRHEQSRSLAVTITTCCLIGSIIGFYDGLIGPGTGSFLIFAFILWMGMDFLNASANAKIINLGTNVAAAGFFIYTSQILWKEALCMAAANVTGSYLGTSLAIKKGNAWVRKLFLMAITLILFKLVYDSCKAY